MTLRTGTQSIATERLTLRRFTPNDLEFLVELHSSEPVTRYIGHGRPRSRRESEAWLSRVLTQYEAQQQGHLIVQRRSDGVSIGRCGLSSLYIEIAGTNPQVSRAWFNREEVPAGCSVTRVAELGYTFDSAYWGQGYASEAVQGVVDYLKEQAQRPAKTVSAIYPENRRSLRIAEKFQLKLEGCLDCSGLPLLRYDWPNDVTAAEN